MHWRSSTSALVRSIEFGAQARDLGHPDWQLMETNSVQTAMEVVRALRARADVVGAWVDSSFPQQKDQFVPNDPYYFPNQPTPGYPGQWYLKNTLVSGRDIRVEAAWLRNLVGQGVVVGIVDDGFEFNHPDLSANYSSSNSFDFWGNDTNVFPGSASDIHGTALLGLIAARGGNSQGITGVAPNAVWAGIRADVDTGTASQLISANLHRSSGANTNIKVKNHSYGPLSPWVDGSSLVNALATSSASGTIHVRSAGNLRGSSGEDVAKHSERNAVQSITVGALGSDGFFSPYSNFGAGLMCVAPSSTTNAGGLVILSTDRVGESSGFNGSADGFPNSDYCSSLTGTSVSSAIATGVLVLAKQAQPNLDSRFAKHLIARTSTVVHSGDVSSSSDGGWRVNGAGLSFNQNYGFGLLNADALTLEAARWDAPSSLVTTSTGTVSVGAAIPDANSVGVTRTFNVTSTTPLEEVQVNLNITHAYRGDLDAYLINPAGQSRRLFVVAGADDGDNIDWTFTTNGFWGENPAGTWTIRVRDGFSFDSGTWNSFAATLRQGQLERVIQGQILRNDWLVSPSGENITVELRPSGGGTPINQVVTLDSSGNFTFRTSLSGEFDLSVKPSHWLRKTLGPVSFSTASVSAGVFNLTNGDINDDNEIGPADFTLFTAAFGTMLGDPGYNSMADLNGDEEVGPADFTILSSTFGEIGDD